MRYPIHAWLILLSPGRIEAGLTRVAATSLVPVVPTLWQVELGVLRMWHRILFRPETIGTCADDPIRATWRARLLHFRPLRFPFLMWERAIAPWDLSGMLSPPARIIRHLLGAHHDGDQFVYDFQILSLYPDALKQLVSQAVAVDTDRSPRSRWLKDLTVFENYHQHLRAAVEGFVAEQPVGPGTLANPDLTFTAWLRWCADQPESPAQTLRAWRRGLFNLQTGVQS